MKPQHRQKRIRELVSRDRQTRVDALASVISFSAGTIRYDPARPAMGGAMRAVLKVARRPRRSTGASGSGRAAEDADAATRSGRRLAEITEPGEARLMDSGSATAVLPDCPPPNGMAGRSGPARLKVA